MFLVWVSPDGGYTWSRCVEDASFDDRYQLHTMLDEREYLIVGNGRVSNGSTNFNDGQSRCSHCGLLSQPHFSLTFVMPVVVVHSMALVDHFRVSLDAGQVAV